MTLWGIDRWPVTATKAKGKVENMSKRSKSKGICAAMRQAIRDGERRGHTRYSIAQAAGIEQSTLSKIVRRTKYAPRLDTAEKILTVLGKRLVVMDEDACL